MRPIAEDQELALPEDKVKPVLQVFDRYFHGESKISKDVLRQVLLVIGVGEAEADRLLSRAETNEEEVCYRDFFKFVFQKVEQQGEPVALRPRVRKLSRQVEEPFIISYFRRTFERICHSPRQGLTKKQLHEVLESFEVSLPGQNTETSDVVAHIFEQIDHNGDEQICWEEFYTWLTRWDRLHDESEEAARSLFTFLDRDANGTIDADEMMNALMLLSEYESKTNANHSLAVTPAEAGLIIRDLDPDNDSGGIDYHTFLEILRAARAPEVKNQLPHLVLNFDVNNTVVMLDSATGADSKGLICMVLSNSAWGQIHYDSAGVALSWECRCSELSPEQPETGLHTYSEFVVLQHPFPAKSADKAAWRAAAEEVKAARRQALWAFTDAGMPGEAFQRDVELMEQQLQLPPNLRSSQLAKLAGLGDTVQLLPSFLHLLRELKRQGRSFTLIFRTFGNDLPKLQKELQALCEGWHPLFSHEPEVVLDGSDGQPDYRMKMDSEGCGTFFRNPGEEDFIALVMGTIDQPKTMEEGLAYCRDRAGVAIHEGVNQVFKQYNKLSTQQRTFALRDYYPGWAATGSTSRGGKPFFLRRLDAAEHCIFFDDHISPLDAKIVDPVDAHLWPRRFSSAQLFGAHLVQAQPLLSIRDRDYFVKCLQSCEEARSAKLHRWHKLKRMVADLDGVRKVLAGFIDSSLPRNTAFRPWSHSRQVARAQQVPTFEDEFELPALS